MEKRDLFIERLKKTYPDNWESVVSAISRSRNPTFRVQHGSEIDLSFPKSVRSGPFVNSYYLDDISELEQLKSLPVYFQGLASMIPVLVADPTSGESVLDLCAAPGSKSSLYLTLSIDKSHITCVDNNVARIHALDSNIRSQGLSNFETIRTDASKIQFNPIFFEKYDKVLADVPCSNEGNIRLNDPKSYANWNPKLAKKINMLQKRILASGIKALKPGGRLVYSTCTYSVEENEEVIAWGLKHFPEISLEPIKLNIENKIPGFLGLSDCVRILPTDLFDGFFVASLLKS